MTITDVTPAPLQLNHPGDVLLLIRVLYGRIPDNSLILVGLRDGQTTNCLRVDANASLDDISQRSRQYAAWCAGGESPHPDAVLVILNTDSTEAAENRTEPTGKQDSYAQLIHTLEDELVSVHATVFSEVWLIANGHMGRFSQRNNDDFQQHNSLNQLMVEGQRRHPELSQLSGGHDPAEAMMDFCAGASSFSSSERQLISRSAEEVGNVSYEPDDLFQTALRQLDNWEHALEQVRRQDAEAWARRDPEAVGELLQGFSTQVLPTILLVSAASGLAVAAAGTAEICHGNSGSCPLEQKDWIATVVQTACQSPISAEEAAELLDIFSASLQGSTGSAPYWERIDALDELLRILRPSARAEQLCHLWMMKTWIEWIRGRGRASAAALEAGLARSPEHLSLQWMGQLTSRILCPWARHPKHAWQSNRAVAH